MPEELRHAKDQQLIWLPMRFQKNSSLMTTHLCAVDLLVPLVMQEN